MENKVYKLSKDAIKYLDRIELKNKTQISVKSITVKKNFNFQIEKVEKRTNKVYNATLFDFNSKSSRFILYLEKEEEIPTKGDLINIRQITKIYKEENKIYIYECKNITFIAKELVFFVNVLKLDNYDNHIININENNINKKEIDRKNQEKKEKEEEEKEIDQVNENKDIYNNDNINIKYINNFNKEEIYKNNIENDKIIKKEIDIGENKFNNNNINDHDFLLVTDLDSIDKIFNIYVKCINKEEIKEFKNRKNKLYQNYIFSDINQDNIEAISFDNISEKIDKIIYINQIYQINNCSLIINNENYRKINFPFKIFFNKNIQIINVSNDEKIKNKFKNEKLNINNNIKNNFISLSNILNKNNREIINIFCFVLKDNGMLKFHDQFNNEYYGKNIILGDDSNYKVNIIFWHPKSLNNPLNKVYNPGELLYIQNCRVDTYKRVKNLYSTKYIKIQNSFNSDYDSKLKKYFSDHSDINDYFELKINEEIKEKIINENNKIINYYNQEYPNIIFIKDIQSIYNRNKDRNKKLIFKISALVTKINHSHKNYYYGCINCKKKMIDNICPNCGNKNKKIIIHFSINVIDSTSSLWLLIYGDLAEDFLRIKGEEYKNILNKGISKENKELNLLNKNIEDKSYVFIGKIKYYSNNENEGYRFHVKFFYKKN